MRRRGWRVDAWLCYVQLPEPIEDPPFRWHVVPAGTLHGAVLALCSVAAAIALSRSRVGVHLLAAPMVGWVAGYASWIPLIYSLRATVDAATTQFRPACLAA